MNFIDLDVYFKRLLYVFLYVWLFKLGFFIGLEGVKLEILGFLK